MTWDPNVAVTVVSGAQPVGTAVLNIPMHVSYSPTFAERVRSYGSSAEATADDLLGAEATAAVAAHFAQDLHTPTIKIGKLLDTPVAQVDTITVAGTPAEGDVYTVVVNGISTSYVAGATPDAGSVFTALSSALTTALADEDITVAGGSPAITLTADNLGEPFYCTVSTDGDGTLTLVHTTANAGVGSDLDAILEEDPDWKWLTSEIDSTPADNLVIMAACSTWCQANKKNYIAQSSDATVLTATAANDLEVLAGKNNSRTAYVWHHDDDELLAIAWAAYKLQADPDAKATGWAYCPLSGISQKDPKLTSTQQGNIEDQYGNCATTFGGALKAGMGITTINQHLDTLVAKDWLEARLGEAYIQLLSDVSANNLSIGLNDKELQVFVGTGQTVLDRGVSIGHLNEGSTSISIPARAAMPAADVTNRLIRVTASGTARGTAERVTVTMTVLLT
jgi:hypothetical protein